MTDAIESKMSKIRQLIDMKELDDALNLVEEIKKGLNSNPNLQARGLLLKSEILRDKLEYREAEKIAKEAFELSKETENPILQFDCLKLLKNLLSWQRNEKKDIKFSNFACFELERIKEEYPLEIKKIEREYLSFLALIHTPINRDKAFEYIFESLSIAVKEGDLRDIALIYHFISNMYMDIGKYNKALNYALDSYDIYEKLNEETAIGLFNQEYSIHNQLSMIYLRLGDLDKNIEHGTKSLEYSKKIGDTFSVGYANFLVGWGYNGKGMLNKALECGFEGYNIWTDLGEAFGIAWCALIIADSYRKKGELNEALKFYNEAEEIFREWENEFSLARTQQGLGIVYREKGMFDLAENNFKESLDSFIANINYAVQRPGRDIARSLYYLILISLERNKEDESSKYLEQLKEFAKQEVGNRLVEHRYAVSKGVFLSKSKHKKNRIEAECILNQIINEDIAEFEVTTLAIYALCDLNIRKIQETKNGILLLQQAEDMLQRLVNIAEKENSFTILAEAYLLRSQIALIKLEIETAEKLLIKAQQIVDEKEINTLAVKISNVYDTLLGHLDKWNEFTSHLPSIAERLELTSIEEMLNHLLRFQSLLSEVKIEKEKPALFFILDKSGKTVFAEKFDKNLLEMTVDKILLIAKENHAKVQKSEIYIPRFRYHEHVLIIKVIENLLFGYGFVGKSYNSIKKLENFTQTIQSLPIHHKLRNKVSKSQPLQLEERIEISKIVDEIFLC